MATSYTVTGTVTDGKTITLDEPLPTPGTTRVRLTAVPIESEGAKPSLREFLNDLRRRQTERGHVPMTADEIEAYIRAERASWGD